MHEFGTWGILTLEVAMIRRWVNCGQKRLHKASNNTQLGCVVQTTIGWYSWAQSVRRTPLYRHHQQQPELLIRVGSRIHELEAKFLPYHKC